MEDGEFVALKICLCDLSLLFNQKVSERKIEAYAKMLRPYSIKEITTAMQRIIYSNEDYFPSCSRIISEINGSSSAENDSQFMSDNIVNTVCRFGRYQQDEIRNNLSEIEIRALRNIGGVLAILDPESHQIPTIKSQLRKTIESIAKNESVNFSQRKAEEYKSLNSLSDIMVDYADMRKNQIEITE